MINTINKSSLKQLQLPYTCYVNKTRGGLNTFIKISKDKSLQQVFYSTTRTEFSLDVPLAKLNTSRINALATAPWIDQTIPYVDGAGREQISASPTSAASLANTKQNTFLSYDTNKALSTSWLATRSKDKSQTGFNSLSKSLQSRESEIEIEKNINPQGEAGFVNGEAYTKKQTPDSAVTRLLTYKKSIKGLVGHPINAETLLHMNSKSIVYSFKKYNNIYPLLTKTEYLLKSIFFSMYSLISRPIYLIKHDKIIIRLFVFLAPKAEKYLDTSTLIKDGKISTASATSADFRTVKGISPTIFLSYKQAYGGISRNKKALISEKIAKFLKIKSIRPKRTEILNYQILSSQVKGAVYPLALLSPFFFKLQNTLKPAEARADYPSFACNITGNNEQRQGKRWNRDALFTKNINTPIRGTNILAPLDKKVEYPYNSYLSTFKLKLERLSKIFSQIFKKEVEFEIIKTQLPFQDSNILAQILGYSANDYNFKRMLKVLLPRAVIKNPSKELPYLPTNRPHKQVARTIDSINTKAIVTSLDLNIKDLNILLSQPSSYLTPFFFSKYNLDPNVVLPAVSSPQSTILELASPDPGLLFKDKNRGGEGSHIEGVTHLNRLKALRLSYLSGMNIKLAGRLMTQSIRPRFTVQSKQEGSLARVKVHFTERSRFTGKNKRGAYSFTVAISHVLNA